MRRHLIALLLFSTLLFAAGCAGDSPPAFAIVDAKYEDYEGRAPNLTEYLFRLENGEIINQNAAIVIRANDERLYVQAFQLQGLEEASLGMPDFLMRGDTRIDLYPIQLRSLQDTPQIKVCVLKDKHRLSTPIFGPPLEDFSDPLSARLSCQIHTLPPLSAAE